MGYAEVITARQEWLERNAPEVARVKLAAVRSVLKVAWRQGLVSTDAYHRAIDLPPIKATTLPRGRALSGEEIERLFAAAIDCGAKSGPRDAAILALFRSGIRIQELSDLNVRDFLSMPGEPAALRIEAGKGRKGRLAYLDEDAAAWVSAWLELRGDEPGPLLCTMRNGVLQRSKRLGLPAIRAICARLAAAAGVNHFSPHDFRRTVATDLKAAGVDLADIRDTLGHESITTTARYFRNDKEAAKKRAIAALSTPRKEKRP